MRLAAAALLCCLLSSVAQAQLPPAQRDAERRAQSLFAAGRYEDAVAIYADLWAGNHDPVYLRNIGRCYQKLRNPERAISSFEEYLAKARRLSPAERREVEGYLRDMHALQAEQEQEAARRREAAPPPARVEPQPALPRPMAPSLPPEPPSVVVTAAPLPPPPPDRGGLVWRRTGMVGLGVAGALAIGGGVAMWSSWKKWTASNNVCQTRTECDAAADSVSARSLASKLLFAGAAAVGLTSGLLIYLHPVPDGAGSTRGMLIGGARTF